MKKIKETFLEKSNVNKLISIIILVLMQVLCGGFFKGLLVFGLLGISRGLGKCITTGEKYTENKKLNKRFGNKTNNIIQISKLLRDIFLGVATLTAFSLGIVALLGGVTSLAAGIAFKFPFSILTFIKVFGLSALVFEAPSVLITAIDNANDTKEQPSVQPLNNQTNVEHTQEKESTKEKVNTHEKTVEKVLEQPKNLHLTKNDTNVVESNNKVQVFKRVYIIKNGITLNNPNMQHELQLVRETFEHDVESRIDNKKMYTDEDYDVIELANKQKVYTVTLKGGYVK